jgi:hypothetical protein
MRQARPCMLSMTMFLLITVSIANAQWVMAAHAAKNHIQRMTQKSENGNAGYDMATVRLEAAPDKVYDKTLEHLRTHPEITITKNDKATGKIEFRRGHDVAGFQITALGEKLTQLIIVSNVGETSEPGAKPLVLDSVMRVCKEFNVECTVQPN